MARSTSGSGMRSRNLEIPSTIERIRVFIMPTRYVDSL